MRRTAKEILSRAEGDEEAVQVLPEQIQVEYLWAKVRDFNFSSKNADTRYSVKRLRKPLAESHTERGQAHYAECTLKDKGA